MRISDGISLHGHVQETKGRFAYRTQKESFEIKYKQPTLNLVRLMVRVAFLVYKDF
jgi:hypothetical protein